MKFKFLVVSGILSVVSLRLLWAVVEQIMEQDWWAAFGVLVGAGILTLAAVANVIVPIKLKNM